MKICKNPETESTQSAAGWGSSEHVYANNLPLGEATQGKGERTVGRFGKKGEAQARRSRKLTERDKTKGVVRERGVGGEKGERGSGEREEVGKGKGTPQNQEKEARGERRSEEENCSNFAHPPHAKQPLAARARPRTHTHTH